MREVFHLLVTLNANWSKIGYTQQPNMDNSDRPQIR